MKKEYLVKQIEAGFGWNFTEKFQKICDDVSHEGWVLQEYHFAGGNNQFLVAVFYREIK